jgi:beta-barrel assembly-enhancing protease
MPGFVLVIIILFLFFNPQLLPRIGAWLGGQSRKPVRQAKWMWSSFAGTEEESIRAEREYGMECARVFAAQFRGEASPADQELVAKIGAVLAGAVKDSRRRFDFKAAAAAPANAFALPGGFIFITTSLLDLCQRNRDEIAFFLGHEIGHVVRGHAKDRMTADTFLNAVMSRLPAAGRMLREVVSKGYSQDQELEADRESVRLAAAAGFDARASVSAMKRLAQAAPDPAGFLGYLASHPPIPERIRELEKLLA